MKKGLISLLVAVVVLAAGLAQMPQAAELKTYFDSSPEELRQALNRLCDALGEFSAAAKLGYRNCALNLSGYKYSFAVFA